MFNKTKTKSAFTLAEVLITLVIIGVVAALTIPNVIYNSKKQEYSARLKKFYSTMKQVQQRAKTDGKEWGDYVNANINNNEIAVIESFAKEYLLPYISHAKTLKTSYQYYIYFSDGSYFRIEKSNNCFQFYFDVNGNKKPNEIGRDIQVFEYCSSSYYGPLKLTFGPYHYSQNLTSRASALSECTNITKKACCALLWFDGWEFKDDYPYRL